MGGAKNRRVGIRTEIFLYKWIARVFGLTPDGKAKAHQVEVGACRKWSKGKDDTGVDIWFREDVPRHIRRLAWQSKRTTSNGKQALSIDVKPLLEMQTATGELPVLFTRIMRNAGSRQSKVADVVTMQLDDFEQLLRAYDRARGRKK